MPPVRGLGGVKIVREKCLRMRARGSFSAPRMKVSEFSETFFVACTSYERRARRYFDKVFALPTEQFQRSELEKIFCEKGIFCNKSASIRASKWL